MVAAFPLFDLGIIVVAATIAAYVAKLFNQPRLLAYILAGVVIGPVGLGLINNSEVIWGFAELGITFLLFIVGLELDLSNLKELGFDSLLIGVGQLVACFIVGDLLALALGFPESTALFLAMAFVFSSTMIVVKIFSDSGELETLGARISVGVLIVQDVAVILVLAMMSSNSSLNASFLALSIIKGIGLFSMAYVAGKVVLPPLFEFVAHSRELLFLSALSWCLGLALFANLLGFSVAIGAFLAGMALAALPFSLEIVGEVRALKDFFSIIFFASLGMELAFHSVAILPLLVFSALVLLFKPLTLLVLTGLRRHTKRTAFFASVPMGQVSEFSLILALHGFSSGVVSHETLSLIVLVAAITLTATSYFSQYGEKMYKLLSPYLSAFERSDCKKYKVSQKNLGGHTILFGCDRTGYNLLKALQKVKKSFLVVDYNPDVINALKDQDIECVYGDLADAELLEHIKLRDAEIIVSTVPSLEDNHHLVLATKHAGKAFIIVTAHNVDDALKLYAVGADYVILPHYLAGERISSVANELLSRTKSSTKKKLLARHLKEIQKIKEEQILLKYDAPLRRRIKEKD